MEDHGYLWLLVSVLLLLQVFSVVFLWLLDTFSQTGESLFALFLSIDLISFAMLSYVYRKRRNHEDARDSVVLAGCAVILILMLGIVLT